MQEKSHRNVLNQTVHFQNLQLFSYFNFQLISIFLFSTAHLSNFQKLNKNLVHSRKHSLKNLDKGTDEYRRRRERNNIAVRKSREKAKRRAHDVEKKLKELQKENDNLRRSDDEKTNVILLYNQVFMRLTNHSNPEIKQIVSLELNSMNMQCDQNSFLHYKDS